MLNKLWGFMILIGIVFAAATGKIGEVGTAALDSSKEASSCLFISQCTGGSQSE